MKIYKYAVPVDEFTHTIRQRGPVIYSGIEPENTDAVMVWSLWDPEEPETVHRYRVVGDGRAAAVEEIPLSAGVPA